MSANQLAVVTGASTGIGLELARCCAQAGFNLVIAADEPQIERVAVDLRRHGGSVEPVEADLATTEGVDKLCAAIGDGPIDALLANAGIGLGKAFLDQDFARVKHLIDTNITGTLYLIHRVGNAMLRRNAGRILITGSIAGFMPGSFQAAYNGSKAFLDSFSFALREELRDSGVTVTCLMPGDRVLPPRRHDGYQGRHREEGQRLRCRQGRLRRNDARGLRHRRRHEEQDPDHGRERDAERDAGQAAPQDGGAGYSKIVT